MAGQVYQTRCSQTNEPVRLNTYHQRTNEENVNTGMRVVLKCLPRYILASSFLAFFLLHGGRKEWKATGSACMAVLSFLPSVTPVWRGRIQCSRRTSRLAGVAGRQGGFMGNRRENHPAMYGEGAGRQQERRHSGRERDGRKVGGRPNWEKNNVSLLPGGRYR